MLTCFPLELHSLLCAEISCGGTCAEKASPRGQQGSGCGVHTPTHCTGYKQPSWAKPSTVRTWTLQILHSYSICWKQGGARPLRKRLLNGVKASVPTTDFNINLHDIQDRHMRFNYSQCQIPTFQKENLIYNSKPRNDLFITYQRSNHTNRS